MGDALLKLGGYALGLGLLYAIYALGRAMGSLYQGPMVTKYLAALGVAGMLGLVSAHSLGTHVEDSDPIYGGGDRVFDYSPSAAERSEHGWFVFFLAAAASIAGLHRGHSANNYDAVKAGGGSAVSEPTVSRTSSTGGPRSIAPLEERTQKFVQGFLHSLKTHRQEDYLGRADVLPSPGKVIPREIPQAVQLPARNVQDASEKGMLTLEERQRLEELQRRRSEK
jgi:hypothetical protein